MMPRMPSLLSINVGRARGLRVGGRIVQSGFVKAGQTGAVEVRPLGLVGDEQADLTVHGGLTKAVYAYPVEHYAFWQTVRSQAGVAPWDQALQPGAMGENLTISGLLENQVWIGDILRFARCDLAVSEPRYPCDKFNAAMGFNQAAKMMTRSAWCGFYLAVRSPGWLMAGEAFEVIAGPREVGIRELFEARTGKG